MKRTGFTLVEVLCVITILVVLAGLTFPALGPAVHASKRSSAVSQLHQLGAAMIMYRTDWDGDGRYGTASVMGLPSEWLVVPPVDGYAKHVPGSDNLWISPCFPHPLKKRVESNTPKMSYQFFFTDDADEYWPSYSPKYQAASMLFVDEDCSDAASDPDVGYRSKLLLGVTVEGQLRRQTRRTRTPLFEWHEGQHDHE